MIQSIFNFLVKLFYFVKFFEKMIFEEGFRNHIIKDTKVENKTENFLVLANGPSLRSILDEIYNGTIKKDNCCMVNYTVNTDDFFRIKPEFYIISDPQFYIMGEYHKEKVLQVYENLNKVSWPINICIQYIWYKDKRYMEMFKNPNLNIVPFHTRIYEGFECFRNPLMKRDIGGANFGTVIQHAIHIGILLGYKEIHLYGADHTFFTGLCVTRGNTLCRCTNHVYETENEANPIYYYDSRNGQRFNHTMSSFLHEYANLYDGHVKMQSFAKYMNVKVVNKTKVSLLDVYPRE